MKARKKSFRFGKATTKDYDRVFYADHDNLIGKVVIHHGVEQIYLSSRKGEFDWTMIHSLEALRGIPIKLARVLHGRVIQLRWNDFRRRNPTPSNEEILDFASEIDARYGQYFLPPIE